MQSDTRYRSTLPICGPDPKYIKKSQVKFIRPAQMSLFARVTSYPPLGQITCPKGAEPFRFTVVLESSTTFPIQPWEVHVWHNITDDGDWTALPLQRCDSSVAPLLNSNADEYHYFRNVFSGEIGSPTHARHAQFTVRYRVNPDAEWQWVNQQQHTSDGEILFPSETRSFDSDEPASAEDFSAYFESLSAHVDVQSCRSEAPGSKLWRVTGSITAAQEGQSGLTTSTLGVPASVVRYFALVRIWSPWLGPRHGKGKFALSEDAILCSFLRTDGVHVVLLGVSGLDNVLTLFGSDDNGAVVVKSKNDNLQESKFQVLASAAHDFEVAMSAVIYEARKLVRPFAEQTESPRVPTPVSPPGDDIVLVEKDVKAQWLAEWFDGLTYCTWNGLGQDLTEEKILRGLDSLKSHGIKIANLIIDDNWQTLDKDESQFRRGWKQFEGNPDAFPKGFKQTIQKIRSTHPNIDHIAVWHAMLGYWGGISPDGELAKRYKTKRIEITDPAARGAIAHAFDRGSILAIDPDDIQRFYDDFYNWLASIGVDSVKADAQFFLDLIKDPTERRRFINPYLDAWSISTLKHFSTRAISCMSMIPQAIFHSQLPTNKPTIPLRNSDDFFPNIESSHPWHVFCNAHNALLTRYLNVVPDWDMFQTSHAYAGFHAAARCVSGGPIYITDEPGKHNIAIIDQMTAPTVHGATVILRPGLIGRTLDIYHDYNEGHVLRVGTYTGWARTGSGILGFFNISSADRTSVVNLLDFPGVHPDSTGEYIVRAHTSGRIAENLSISDTKALVSVEVKHRGWEILTAYPTYSFGLPRRHNPPAPTPGDHHLTTTTTSSTTKVAVLGLLGKMTGAAAIVNSDLYVQDNGRLRADINLKALGTLGLYFSDLPDWDIDANVMVTILGKPVPRRTVWKEGISQGEKEEEEEEEASARVLAVDVLAAWKEMGLKPGWSNEVLVEVFVG
ncbi:putative raffinose synthase protein Sip1 [Aspergillus saccharolyticus JOP 1030-1]|uniref:Glycoside hydrolase n=1 Tax=Aspergillus saccharolyticus JOP 1030-1 TaxID=1450539 RepID=A0A319A5N8_9EURO|nr:glycoside hydrolase [Aspergillus saccharolyticus JOP 1030-1]PYH47378.1 glycoside hydrolase [Aspergillus saccharolyticus JOP 1030-1]